MDDFEQLLSYGKGAGAGVSTVFVVALASAKLQHVPLPHSTVESRPPTLGRPAVTPDPSPLTAGSCGVHWLIGAVFHLDRSP